MTATTEAPAVNAHQPVDVENRLNCAAEGCGFSMHTYGIPGKVFDEDPEKLANYWRSLFLRSHTEQFEPGRAPDITVDWTISASCSVCPDGIGDVVTNDSESVICNDCNTTWHIDGTSGELAEQEED